MSPHYVLLPTHSPPSFHQLGVPNTLPIDTHHKEQAVAKKSETIDGFATEKQGPGWKRCPACSGYVKGPLTKECPCCHHKFEFRSRVIAKPVAASRDAELEQHVLLLALKLGSLEAVAKAFAKLKTDPLMAFTIRCGGTENTLRLIGAIDAKIKEVQVH